MSTETNEEVSLIQTVHIQIPDDTTETISTSSKTPEQNSPVTDQTTVFYEQELARLRSIITLQNTDNLALEQKLSECEQQAKSKCDELNADFTLKLEQTHKSFRDGQNEKTSSLVMKYALGEKKCIELNRSIEQLKSRLEDSGKEKKRVNERLEKEMGVKNALNGEYEKKIAEIMIMKKETIKLKEVVIVAEAKEKTNQTKFKLESEAHLACKKLLESTTSELTTLKTEQADKTNCSDSEEIENEKLNGQELPEIVIETSESGIQLKVEAGSKSGSNSPTGRESLQIKELQTLKSQLKDMFEERTTLRESLAGMDKERKLQESSLSKFKETLQNQKQMNKDLLTEILQLRELKETLTNEKNEKVSLEQKLQMLTIELEEVQEEMNLSQNKQTELLAFTAKLTEKNTTLQSEVTTLNDGLTSLKAELDEKTTSFQHTNITTKQSELELGVRLNEALVKVDELQVDIGIKTSHIEKLTVSLLDEQDELVSLKKKHQGNIKDLSRQLSSAQKKIQLTTIIKQDKVPDKVPGTQLLINSRTNSITSLPDNGGEHVGSSSYSLNEDSRSCNEVICGGVGVNGGSDVYVVDVDKQKIIEKVMKLQNLLAKRNEKIDFLQDHVNQLTIDLKRKTKIIQAFAMNELELGGFTSEAHDAIKLEMSRKTAAMLHTNNKSYMHTAQFIKSNESHMTKELCLEINNKLQALLEDTLIKNITLKDSLDTLGQEIARLSKENRQICMSRKT